MTAAAEGEVRGVRLGDVYRDQEGELWEVIGICTEPTASFGTNHDRARGLPENEQ